MTAAFGTAGAVRLGLGVADPRPRRPAGDRLYPSQDNPLMDAGDVHGTPLLGNDLWEHAYYLTYRNRRADYLDAWWQLVDWAEVSRRYTAATARS